MRFTCIFLDEFVLDLQEVYNYYHRQGTLTVAENVLKEVRRIVGLVQTNPYLYSVRYGGDIRCGITQKFPFMVHYKINEEEQRITFVALVNTYRKPLW